MSRTSLEELNLLYVNVCKALADPKRIMILYSLDEKPRHVTALADDLRIPQSTVSRHLKILKQHSLVISEREGTSVIYTLSDHRIIDVLDLMRQVSSDAYSQRSTLLFNGKLS
jgi:DNA-binding transcriptional ArsR family regulator